MILHVSPLIKLIQYRYQMVTMIFVMKWLKDAQGIIVVGGNDLGKRLTQLSRSHGVIVDELAYVSLWQIATIIE